MCVFQFIVLYGGRLLFHVEADCFSISWCTGAEIVKRFEPSFFSFLFFLFFSFFFLSEKYDALKYYYHYITLLFLVQIIIVLRFAF